MKLKHGDKVWTTCGSISSLSRPGLLGNERVTGTVDGEPWLRARIYGGYERVVWVKWDNFLGSGTIRVSDIGGKIE